MNPHIPYFLLALNWTTVFACSCFYVYIDEVVDIGVLYTRRGMYAWICVRPPNCRPCITRIDSLTLLYDHGLLICTLVIIGFRYCAVCYVLSIAYGVVVLESASWCWRLFLGSVAFVLLDTCQNATCQKSDVFKIIGFNTPEIGYYTHSEEPCVLILRPVIDICPHEWWVKPVLDREKLCRIWQDELSSLGGWLVSVRLSMFRLRAWFSVVAAADVQKVAGLAQFPISVLKKTCMYLLLLLSIKWASSFWRYSMGTASVFAVGICRYGRVTWSSIRFVHHLRPTVQVPI